MSTLRVDTLVNRVGNGAPNFAYGLTAPSAVFTGNVSIGGTLTYEDVQNVDAVGLITARQGIKVTTGGIEVSSGVVTATSFSGDGSQLTGISSPGGASGLQFDDNVAITFGDVSSSDKITLSNTANSIEIKNNAGRGLVEVDQNNFLAKYDDGSSAHWRLYTTPSGIEVKGLVTVSGAPGSQGLGAGVYPEFKVNGIPQVNLFDRKGNLISTFVGKQEAIKIRESIDNLEKKAKKPHEQILNSEFSIIKENKNNEVGPRSHG